MLEMTLDVDQLRDLSNAYHLRHPTEACGVIIPSPHKGKTVFEMPNRSLTPHDSFMLKGEDLKLELQDWFLTHEDELPGVIFWHTHPSGDPKPSKADRAHRVNGAMNVIVSFSKESGSIELYWF
jgi:proteasome lid subunit RPN8/RPN11